jgi:membrane-associated phospholipid phosphatase
MQNTFATNPSSIEQRKQGNEKQRDARKFPITWAIMWVLGLLLLAFAAYYLHGHPGPLPGELSFSRGAQSLHFGSWFASFMMFFGIFNDIPEAIAATTIWFIGMCLFRWFKQAIFFLLTIGVGNTINALIGDYVRRPRPNPHLIHVDTKLVFNSFPSGHTENDVVHYGFLLFLSFTRPVREWRYSWVLIPFRIFAVVAILCIGFSRVYEGEHWASDVLGGYLSGALWLSLFIFLFYLKNSQTTVTKKRKVDTL